ncbi:MAG: maleate cis-trans isomerase family protein [Solirubrobacteraceae bacterium]
MATHQPYRVGMIVPSSNTTMETEIPALLSRRQRIAPERFTFHSARMRMTTVSDEQLRAMEDASVQCAVHLSDARCDVLAYACLVAIMARGGGYHEAAQERLARAAADNGGPAPVVSSAGALVDALHAMGARRTALITPYVKPLTKAVSRYIEECGIEVADAVSLEVDDNVAVGRLDPRQLPGIARELALQGVDAVVLSACVQMPSLEVIAQAEQELGLPVLSAATATTRKILLALGLEPTVPDAGSALSADNTAVAAAR